MDSAVLAAHSGLFFGLIFASRDCRLPWKAIFQLLGLSVLGMGLGVVIGVYQEGHPWAFMMEKSPVIFFLVYVVSGALLHRKELVPRHSEAHVFLLTQSFLYAAWTKGWFHSGIVKSIVIVPVLLTFVSALTRIHLGLALRMALTVWFSVMVMVLSIHQFISLLWDPSRYETTEGLLLHFGEFFFLGSSILILGSYALLYIGLMQGKRESVASWKRRVKEDILPVLTTRMSPEQVPPLVSVALLLLHGGPLLLNGFFHWIPSDIMISYALALSPRLMGTLFGRNPPQ